MEKVQQGKSATRNECNTKKVQHEVTREKMQREKSVEYPIVLKKMQVMVSILFLENGQMRI